MMVVQRHQQVPLGHHLHQVSQAQLEPKIPAHAQDNDLVVEVTPREQLIHALHLTHRRPSARSVCQPSLSVAPFAPEPCDDATLKQTAKAYVKVRQIVQKAELDLNNTTDHAQQQQIAKHAESRKMAAVKAEGLQPQQYNQVIQLARVDKAFKQKFLSSVNAVKNSSSGARQSFGIFPEGSTAHPRLSGLFNSREHQALRPTLST